MKKLMTISTMFTSLLSIIATLSCGGTGDSSKFSFGFNQAKNYQGNIYAARNANFDNLITLGYQPKYVNKTFDGQTISSYLINDVKPNYTVKLHDRPSWDQTIDVEDFISKDIKTAFIAAFQTRLYSALRSTGLPKENIGLSTMGETYIPDMEYRMAGEGNNIREKRLSWNSNPELVKFGSARPTSEDASDINNVKKLSPVSGNGKVFTFDYAADIRESLKITAESVDRITNKTESSKRADGIINVFNQRISDLKTKANVGNKSALALKPNYNAQSIDEIIDSHFAWDPTIFPFLYSENLGLGYEMPNYEPGHGTIEWLEDDVDGLVLDSAANVKETFASQVDTLFFLKPRNYAFSDQDIKSSLASMTKSQNVNDVYVVSEDVYYQANFGMFGYFNLMDQYANDFGITSFQTGKSNWGWQVIDKSNLRESL